MIQATILQDGAGDLIGFRMLGHAGYAEHGSDIVCAGVSALVINTINAIERFTEETFVQEICKGRDEVFFEITSRPVGHDACLLLDSLAMGLEAMSEEYGKKYIRLIVQRKQEV